MAQLPVSRKIRERIGGWVSTHATVSVFSTSVKISEDCEVRHFSLPKVETAEPTENYLDIAIDTNLEVFDTIPTPSIYTNLAENVIATKIDILDIPVRLKVARIRGKFYHPKHLEREQLSLIENQLSSERCKHGLPERCCTMCRRQKLEVAKKEAEKIDIFDIIFPVLQPPPGSLVGCEVVLPADKNLYPFQNVGVKALVENKEFLLGDEMGLGKSIQAIIALRILFRQGEATRCLIVCPRSVLTDWIEKLVEWAPELYAKGVDGGVLGREILWNTKFHISVVTYGTLRRDVSLCQEQEFDVVILDEAQGIKNRSTATSKAVKSLQAERRWVLTGTPLENSIDDLVSIFEFLKPGLMNPTHPPGPSRASSIIKPYFLRRKKLDVLKDLPKKKLFEQWIELTPEQRESYRETEEKGVLHLRKLGEKATAFHILQLIQELKKICNFDPKTRKSSKVDFLVENLEGIVSQGDKTLIFSQYANIALPKIEQALLHHKPLLYTGNLSSKQRDAVMKQFKENAENKVMLISRAGETGVTITAANYVFHFDMWWNPASGKQVEDRVHRIGQEKDVFVYRFFCKNTYEERIYQILKEKQQLFDTVIDNLSDKDLDNTFTEEELFKIFGLEGRKKKEKDKKLKPNAVSKKRKINYERCIKQGEDKSVEFKASMRWDSYQDKENKELAYDIAKTLAAFMNSEGGTLFIGVEDNGDILGLEGDYKTLGAKQNRDGFLLQFTHAVNTYLGKEVNSFVLAKVEFIGGREVCVAEVSKSGKPVYVKKRDKEEFFIRTAASSESLGVRETNNYIQTHW